MPISRHVRITLRAISPLLAINTFLNIETFRIWKFEDLEIWKYNRRNELYVHFQISKFPNFQISWGQQGTEADQTLPGKRPQQVLSQFFPSPHSRSH